MATAAPATAVTAAKLVEAGPKDRERVLNFLRAEFFSAEPLNTAFQTPYGPSNARYVRALGALEQGCAVLAVDGVDVVGLVLCVETPSPHGHLPHDLNREGAGAYAGVLRTLEALEAAAQQRCPTVMSSNVRRVLEVRVLCVARRAQRRGLAAQLLARAIAQARAPVPLALHVVHRRVFRGVGATHGDALRLHGRVRRAGGARGDASRSPGSARGGGALRAG